MERLSASENWNGEIFDHTRIRQWIFFIVPSASASPEVAVVIQVVLS
jgi:hypothetical protein